MRRCYAAHLGGCKGPLTREHFLSEAILKLGTRKTVQVTGRRWQTQPVQEVSPNSLASKVLCEKHNNELSDIDTAGKRFFERLVYVANNLIHPHDESAEITERENGTKLERWFLKYMCGSWAAGDFRNSSDNQLPLEPPPELVQAVFDRHPLTEPCGLWIGDNDGVEFSFSFPFTMEETIYLENNLMLGTSFRINGLVFILNLTNDRDRMNRILSETAICRPRSLTIVGRTQTGEGGIHHIDFDWGTRLSGKPVFIRQTRIWMSEVTDEV